MVDNLSREPLARRLDLGWHCGARLVREETLGLTPARLRGIREAAGEVLVFVDDDNVLDPDYLETALRIAGERPFLGAWSGQCLPCFDEAPAAWTERYWGTLCIRRFETEVWSNLPRLPDTMPAGAGLCVRRAVAQRYLDLHDGGQRRFQLDRTGDSLISGGDNDLAACACDLGLGMGLTPDLKLEHLIPPQRLTADYLERLVEGIEFSAVVLDASRGLARSPRSAPRPSGGRSARRPPARPAQPHPGRRLPRPRARRALPCGPGRRAGARLMAAHRPSQRRARRSPPTADGVPAPGPGAALLRALAADTRFTVVSNNCWGAHIYQALGIAYATPFVGLFIPPTDYLELVRNLDALVGAELSFVRESRSASVNEWRAREQLAYPIGLLGGRVEIDFQHYRSEDEARAAWRRRCARINPDPARRFFKFDDREGATAGADRRVRGAAAGQQGLLHRPALRDAHRPRARRAGRGPRARRRLAGGRLAPRVQHPALDQRPAPMAAAALARMTPKVLHVVGVMDRWSVETWLLQLMAHAARRGQPLDWTFYCAFGQPGARDCEARALGARVVRSPVPIGDKLAFAKALRAEVAERRLRCAALPPRPDLGRLPARRCGTARCRSARARPQPRRGGADAEPAETGGAAPCSAPHLPDDGRSDRRQLGAVARHLPGRPPARPAAPPRAAYTPSIRRAFVAAAPGPRRASGARWGWRRTRRSCCSPAA